MSEQTSNVHDIEEAMPHQTAELICVHCHHRAIHVWPMCTALKALECDGCDRSGYLIKTGQDLTDSANQSSAVETEALVISMNARIDAMGPEAFKALVQKCSGKTPEPALENEFSPNWVSPPGRTLDEFILLRGVTWKDLALCLGKGQKWACDLKAGRAKLSAETAVKLEELFPATPAEFWMNLETAFRLFLERRKAKEGAPNV